MSIADRQAPSHASGSVRIRNARSRATCLARSSHAIELALSCWIAAILAHLVRSPPSQADIADCQSAQNRAPLNPARSVFIPSESSLLKASYRSPTKRGGNYNDALSPMIAGWRSISPFSTRSLPHALR